MNKDRVPAVPSTNECGKIAYFSKSAARKSAARMTRDVAHRMRPYYCLTEEGGCGLVHLGHLPQLVIDGVVTADEWYGRGSPAYGVILFGCLDLLRVNGARGARFTRTPDGDWNASATAGTGRRIHCNNHPDPVTATEALLAAVTDERAGRDAEGAAA